MKNNSITQSFLRNLLKRRTIPFLRILAFVALTLFLSQNGCVLGQETAAIALARIFHTDSAAACEHLMGTALASNRSSGSMKHTAVVAIHHLPCLHQDSRRLATNQYEICGLDVSSLEQLPETANPENPHQEYQPISASSCSIIANVLLREESFNILKKLLEKNNTITSSYDPSGNLHYFPKEGQNNTVVGYAKCLNEKIISQFKNSFSTEGISAQLDPEMVYLKLGSDVVPSSSSNEKPQDRVEEIDIEEMGATCTYYSSNAQGPLQGERWLALPKNILVAQQEITAARQTALHLDQTMITPNPTQTKLEQTPPTSNETCPKEKEDKDYFSPAARFWLLASIYGAPAAAIFVWPELVPILSALSVGVMISTIIITLLQVLHYL